MASCGRWQSTSVGEGGNLQIRLEKRAKGGASSEPTYINYKQIHSHSRVQAQHLTNLISGTSASIGAHGN